MSERDHRGLDHLPDEAYDDDDDHVRTTRRTDIDSEPPEDGRSPLLWLTLRFFLPALLAAGLVLYGMHLGAQYPEAWYTRLVAWFAEVFA